MNSWIHSALKQVKNNIFNEDRYDLSIDRLEILISLSHAHHEKDSNYRYWIPPGLFFYRTKNRERILREIEESMTKHSNKSPYVKSGIFGETVEECLKEFATFKEFVSKNRSRGW